MGLLDKLIGKKKSDDAEATDLTKEEQTKLPSKPSEIDKALAERASKVSLDQCMKIPFSDIATLGVTFAQLIPSLRTVTQTFTIDGMGYIPINNLGGEMLKPFRKNTPGVFAGAFKNSVTGQSVFAEFVKAEPQSISSGIVMPIDPTTILIAAMLATIEKKLDTIQKTQLKILSFLEEDKQAEQEGNLKILTDMLQSYKHNWNNPQYLQNHHMKVLDIKQSAEKNIVFYQKQIADSIRKMPSVYTDQAVKSGIADLGKLFGNYRMALYLFAFSAFLEVLLLGNFSQDYLRQVAKKVQAYDEHYQAQFTKCHDLVQKFSTDSIETKVVSGIGHVSKALGQLIASTPVLAQGPVDEWLKDSGEKLLQSNDEKLAKSVAIFTAEKETGNKVFIDSIQNVAAINHQTTDILFDEDTLYLAMT